jgi:hypothetical protein
MKLISRLLLVLCLFGPSGLGAAGFYLGGQATNTTIHSTTNYLFFLSGGGTGAVYRLIAPADFFKSIDSPQMGTLTITGALSSQFLTSTGWAKFSGATNTGTLTNAGRADFGSDVRIGGNFTNAGISTLTGQINAGAGIVALNGSVTVNPSAGIQMNGRSIFYSTLDGDFNMASNNASGFRKLTFGHATSAVKPALQIVQGDLALIGADGVITGATNKFINPGGVIYPTNSVLPSAAALGVGGYWIGNSNGILIALYSLNATGTVMKILAP